MTVRAYIEASDLARAPFALTTRPPRCGRDRPRSTRTGTDLRAALADITPPDDTFADDIADALAPGSLEERDPWADA